MTIEEIIERYRNKDPLYYRGKPVKEITFEVLTQGEGMVWWDGAFDLCDNIDMETEV